MDWSIYVRGYPFFDSLGQGYGGALSCGRSSSWILALRAIVIYSFPHLVPLFPTTPRSPLPSIIFSYFLILFFTLFYPPPLSCFRSSHPHLISPHPFFPLPVTFFPVFPLIFIFPFHPVFPPPPFFPFPLPPSLLPPFFSHYSKKKKKKGDGDKCLNHRPPKAA